MQASRHVPPLTKNVRASWNNKTPQDKLGVCSFRSTSLFWCFQWNERLNNPEKNSNTRYRSDPQCVVWVVVGTSAREKPAHVEII